MVNKHVPSKLKRLGSNTTARFKLKRYTKSNSIIQVVEPRERYILHNLLNLGIALFDIYLIIMVILRINPFTWGTY